MQHHILHAAVLGAVLSSTATAQVFVDDFNGNTSALYSIAATADAVATFAFDYSTLGIPSAPNTPDNTTLGLKLEANVTSATVNAVTLHTVLPFSGAFVVKFDAWINANGPFPAGGAGSTEFLTMGVGGNGSTPNLGTTGSGGWFAVSGEGGSTRDYRAYKNAGEQFAESGQFNAGLSSAGGGAHNSSDPYYAQFGNIDVGALPQSALFPQQTGITGPGTFGFAWHEVEMRVVPNGGTGGATSVSWWIDGLQIARLDAGIGSTFSTNGAVTIGYADIFTSLSNNAALSFGLIDNLRVGDLATATTFGAGCAGSAGVPALAATSAPEIGATLMLDATNLDAASPFALLAIGFSNTVSPLGPLPASLQPLGLGAGCDLLVSANQLLLIGASGGTGTFSLAIPQNLQFVGTDLYFQAGSLDGTVPGNLAVSNGVAVQVGL